MKMTKEAEFKMSSANNHYAQSTGCWTRLKKMFKDTTTGYTFSEDEFSNRYHNFVARRGSDYPGLGRDSILEAANQRRISDYVQFDLGITDEDDIKFQSTLIDYYDNMGYFASEDANVEDTNKRQNVYKNSMPDNRRVSLRPSIFLGKIEEEETSTISSSSVVSEPYFQAPPRESSEAEVTYKYVCLKKRFTSFQYYSSSHRN